MDKPKKKKWVRPKLLVLLKDTERSVLATCKAAPFGYPDHPAWMSSAGACTTSTGCIYDCLPSAPADAYWKCAPGGVLVDGTRCGTNWGYFAPNHQYGSS